MNATDTGAALLAAILAEPADDLHRLAYADWCEENGRGEFAAVARGDAVITPGQFWDWYASYPDSWLRAWSGSPAVRVVHQYGPRTVCVVRYQHPRFPVDWTFELWRGFVREVEWPLLAWLDHGPALVRRQPVERVVVTGANPVDHLRPGEWWWWTNGPAESHIGCDIPPYLWACLRKPPARHYWGRRYDSEREAVDDLSAACLEWAKERGVTG